MTRIVWNKRTREEIEKIIADLGYILLDEYAVTKKQRVRIQDKIGYKYDVPLANLMNGHIPDIIGTYNPYSLENIVLWLSLNKPKFKLAKNNEYKGNKKKLKFYDSTCDEYFYAKWDAIIAGRGCPICRGMQVGERHSLAHLFPNLMKEWHPCNTINPEKITRGYDKNVYWICSVCEYGKDKEWLASPHNRTGKHSGCPKCVSSKGEDKIKNFLSLNNIKYVFQKKFSNCKNKRQLPFDFGIPYNDGSWKCLEYHGGQHFFPVDFAGKGEEWAKKQFKELRRRDRIKVKYCKDNNIPLLIIPYWEFDNVEKILTKFL